MSTPVARRLDRRKILETALEIVDREGLEALTMRRLGSALDVNPMAVYHYLESKERLYDGLAELLWDEVARPRSSGDARAPLRMLGRSLRAVFRRHPAAAPLLLRCMAIPRSELELFSAYLDVLSAAGVEEPATVLRAVVSYALGSAYTESSMLSAGCAPAEGARPNRRDTLLSLGAALPVGIPPKLASAAVALIADCSPDRCFEDGLELMLAGVGSGKR